MHKFTANGLTFVLVPKRFAKGAKDEETWIATKDGILRVFKCSTSLTDDEVMALAPEAQIVESQQIAGKPKKGY